MEQFFDQFARMMNDWQPAGEFRALRRDHGVRTERVEDGYRVIADLPGFEREAIDLQYHDDVLTIEATQEASDDTRTHRREFHEQITVPSEVDADAITATYRNGVLEVTLPLVEPDAEAGRHIDID